VRICLLLDVIASVVLGEDGEEEVAPLVVVALGRVEFEFDVSGDVDATSGGRGGNKLDGGIGEMASQGKGASLFIITGGRRGSHGEEGRGERG
jgi:hypothetical protein